MSRDAVREASRKGSAVPMTTRVGFRIVRSSAGVVATPPLDEQKLPGVTRFMLLAILRRDGSIGVEERVVTLAELRRADEVWLSSSSKEIIPVIKVDDRPVADGNIGDVWLAAQTLYTAHKFDF